MPEVGLIITAEDKAAAVLGAIGKTGKASLEGIRGAANKLGSGLKKIGVGFAIFNQVLELGKKAVGAFRVLIVDNVRAMIEYRGEMDSVSKKFREIADEAAYSRAVIADLLTPVIFGLADAWKETGSDLVDYINTNRRLIATNIVAFLADTASVLVKGIAYGAQVANLAVSGLVLIWDVLKIGVGTAISGILSGLDTLLKGLSDVAEFAGKMELAIALDDASEAMWRLGQDFEESADNAKTDLAEHVAALGKREEMIKKFRDVALTFTGEARAAMLKWAASWKGVNRPIDETTDAIKNQREAFKSLEVTTAEYYQRVADLRERDARLIDAHMEKERIAARQTAQAWASAGQSIIGSWGAVVDAVASGADNVRATMVSAAIATAKTVIMTAAASAAAKQFESAAGLGPGIGIVIGAALAAAAFGAVQAYMTKFQYGGVVTGGTAGRDSVPALLTPGERVLTIEERRLYERGGHGGSVTNNVTFAPKIDMLTIPSSAQRKKMLLDLADDFDELVSDGQFARKLQRA